MIIRSPEPEVKIVVDRDPIKTSFEEWARPGHFSRTIAKGPDTTTWIWNLHADAHDFDSHTSDLEEISRKVFSAHFGQLSIIFLWLSGMYFHGARFSNYEAWLSDPTHIAPSAQVVWPIVGQEILNGDVGGGFRGIQITSGFFQIWRASGITSELQLYCTAIGALVFASLMLFAGWFHYHKAAPKLAWFQDVESMLNHHLAGLLGLGSLSWAGHQIHVSLPINQFLDAGVDPKEIPLPHEFILNRDLLAQLYPSFAEGATPFFTLNWSKYAEFLTFRGGLDPITGGLWLTDIAHHHLAIAILFLIAGHMYRTNWGIGHGIKDILEAHKGPFTGQGHKGLYEILTTSWHAQLSLNLAMLGSLTIIVAHHMYSMPPYPYLAIDYGRPQDMFSDTAIQLQPIFAQWIQDPLHVRPIAHAIWDPHFGQLSIIFLWLSGMYFHGARFSNYEAWLSDPTHIAPSAQVVWPIVGQEILNGDVGGGFRGIQITSGFFQIWRASGITSELQLYCTAIGALVFASLMLFAGWFHYHKAAPKLAWFQDVESMLNHHLAGLLGLGSLSWAGHQIHVSLPINQFLDAGVDPKEIPLPHEFILNRDLLAQLYPSFAEGATPFFTLNWSKYAEFLTFRGGLDPITGGLWLTDIAHHHLAIAILFLIAGHMYRTNWGIGHGIKDILEAHKGPFTGQGHKGLYEILTTSWHAQLSLNLAMLGSLTIIVAHHMYSMPPYPYLAIDYGTQLSLFTHHMWIGGFLIVGAAAHAAIFMVRDYDPTTRYNDLLDRVLRHRDAIISHLNWACIFLGFHSFGLYIHNDTMSALGRPQDMFSDTAIQLQPIFAQWVQNTHALAPGITAPGATASTSLTWGGGELVAVGGKVALLPIPLGTADFLVHHIHAFTIHVTVLILLKGVLFARSSRLIPDKANLGFRFPCDGPGRGGTCQVSAWDHVFLGLFWMYNAISVVIFHFSWKMQSDVWGTISDQGVVTHITGGNFAQSSITINGWLRDFLWAQASQFNVSIQWPWLLARTH
ncbi:hypothetical protein C4D60_Mb00t11160 [Musa balbisiana]|uniref:Photosystem I P700 chlorophyll a apoprotein A1 n=1 Tax=Musa balbisiana TaxID=52838 RepID=A0A4S8I2Y4_MUSBA|nr:hypothetical protein C4D60_Mb00t11160 [Musa balbisiana]